MYEYDLYTLRSSYTVTDQIDLILLPIAPKFKKILAAIGRGYCADICLAIMSPRGDEWRRFSDIYYEIVAQRRLPWATYSKLVRYLIANKFVEKSERTVGNRKAVLVRLTDLGRELVKLYLALQGKQLEQLEFQSNSKIETGR
jgi:DNA-binding MarR family transcriptional regulator